MASLSHCLWFDGAAEEAARFYVSLIPDSRIVHVSRPSTAWPGGKAGDVLAVDFVLDGRKHLALNGGPNYRLSPAISLVVSCEDQAEIDRLWDALLAGGGVPMQCGWLTDRFGLSWQIVPKQLGVLMSDPDPAKVGRVMGAFMPMVKLDLAKIQAAYDGAST